MTQITLRPQDRTIRELARETLDILDRDGWNAGYTTFPSASALPLPRAHRRAYRRGSHCLGGAMNLALTYGAADSWQGDPRALTFYRAVALAMGGTAPELSGDVLCWAFLAAWNNEHSEPEVRAVLGKFLNAPVTAPEPQGQLPVPGKG